MGITTFKMFLWGGILIAVKLNFRRYTSSNENFELSYPLNDLLCRLGRLLTGWMHGSLVLLGTHVLLLVLAHTGLFTINMNLTVYMYVLPVVTF